MGSHQPVTFAETTVAMTQPSDAGADTLERLAASAQAGDDTSFQELARRVRGPLQAFLRTRLSAAEDADDVAQETLLRAYERLDQYDATRPFTTWLYTIGKRLAINHYQSQTRRQTANAMVAAEPTDVSKTPEPSRNLWHRARQVLPQEQYHALWLRYVQDLSIKEVASELGRTTVSTKVLLYRSRKRLLLEVEGP